MESRWNTFPLGADYSDKISSACYGERSRMGLVDSSDTEGGEGIKD